MASLSEQAPLPFSPDIVEAMAAARAISFARELGIKPFILEGDSEVVINTLIPTEGFSVWLEDAPPPPPSPLILFSSSILANNSSYLPSQQIIIIKNYNLCLHIEIFNNSNDEWLF